MTIEVKDHLKAAITQGGKEFVVERDRIMMGDTELWSAGQWPSSEEVVAEFEDVDVDVTWGSELGRGLIRFRPPEGRTFQVEVSYGSGGEVDKLWFRTIGE